MGLFGVIGAGIVRNLGLEDVGVSGNSRVGGLAGENWGGRLRAVYVTGIVSGNGNVGGLDGLEPSTSVLSGLPLPTSISSSLPNPVFSGLTILDSLTNGVEVKP